jgi:hypothetical protein
LAIADGGMIVDGTPAVCPARLAASIPLRTNGVSTTPGHTQFTRMLRFAAHGASE